jgi:hypothetical protein
MTRPRSNTGYRGRCISLPLWLVWPIRLQSRFFARFQVGAIKILGLLLGFLSTSPLVEVRYLLRLTHSSRPSLDAEQSAPFLRGADRRRLVGGDASGRYASDPERTLNRVTLLELTTADWPARGLHDFAVFDAWRFPGFGSECRAARNRYDLTLRKSVVFRKDLADPISRCFDIPLR